MRTRIELGTSGDIELFEDISTPLTFSIADIRKPETRQGSFSKTIKIPGTKQNNILLGHIFDINIGDCTFNPKLKTPARLYINDVPQITGYMQLLKIVKNDNYKIEYEVAIFGKNSNIFIDLGESLLTDLDYTEFNHQYTRDEQEGSWTQDYTYGYVYPLIDYGFDTDINKYDVEHLFPATYLRTYIDKIFAAKGYTYQSTFFDSTFFKKLIVPYNGSTLKLTSPQVDARIFNAYDSTTRTYAGNSIATILTVASETNDPSNQFNTGTYKWTVANSGYYNVYSAIEYYLESTAAAAAPSNTRINLQLYHTPNGSAFSNVIGGNFQDFGWYPTGAGQTATSGDIYLGVGNVLLLAGDVVELRIWSQYFGTIAPHNIKVTDAVFENSVVNSGLLTGNTVDYNAAIPEKIKQKDLLTSVIKAFNLYIDVDTDNDKKLIIETRDDFYSSGDTKDWTYKLDVSKDLEYTPLGDLDFRRFKYSYKKDADKYNKTYEETWQEVYGSYEYDNGNEFLNNDNKTEIIFSPTPICDDVSSNRVVPRLWNVSDTGVVSPKAFNIRLLYWGGLISNNVDWVHTERGGTDISRSTYPYAGHVDNPVTPTLDLNFGVPREIYYFTNYYTNNNLFNRYHKKFIEEITHKDSKIVTGYFHLNPVDILNLDFRDNFYFDNQFFRLNKIYDYNPIVNELTKCEFIKLKDAQPFVAETVNVNGAGATSGTIVLTPFFGTDGIVNNNNNTDRVDGNTGGGNTFGSGIKSYIGNGSDNYIHDYVDTVAMVNSSGDTVYAGLKNVTLIGTNDQVITSGDVVFINGVVTPKIFSMYSLVERVDSSTKTFTVSLGGGLVLVDTGATDTGINLPSAGSIYYYDNVYGGAFGKILNIKKIDSGAGHVIISPDGSETIDGQLTQSLTTQYDNITIQSDGTNWHIL